MSDKIKIPDTLPVIGAVLHLRSTKNGIDAKRTPLKYMAAGTEKAHRRARREMARELGRMARFAVQVP